LLNLSDRHAEAYARLMGRQFHPWEGGEGKTTGQYVLSLIEQAKALLAAGQPGEAAQRLEQAMVYPPNLGEGKLPAIQENNIDYFAVSLPTFLVFEEAPDQRHRLHCHYMAALGHLGLGQQADAQREFDQVLALEADHQGALLQRNFDWAPETVL